MKAKWEVKSIEHHPAIRTKKQNNVAARQMENQISFMENKCLSQTARLEQSMRNLRRQLDDMSQEKERTGEERTRQRITSSYIMRQYSVTPELNKLRRNSRSCEFLTPKSKHQCQHFPCTAPTSYHTIGFRIDPDNTSWVPWKQLRHNLSDTALAAMGKSAILNTGISRLTAQRRSELLKLEMESRRKRSEKEKPPSWQVNYGKPTPYKRLKYPVKLDPLDMTL
ncbi:uncharacterized protein [Argopecten irradians]|uniref:uncharacterized protein n=1 Tax=Argopecten irradians TaxID=31199 RepID=UPI003720E34F